MALPIASVLALLTACTSAAVPEPGATPTPSPTPAVPIADQKYAEGVPWLQVEGSLAGFGFAVESPSEPDVVAGPGFALELREVAVTDELTSEQRDALLLPSHTPEGRRLEDQPLLAGPGQEFLVARLDRPEDAPIFDLGDFRVSVAVEDEAPRVVEGFSPSGGGVMVVNVPVGAPVIMNVLSDGEIRSINLRTGRNASDSELPTDGLAGASTIVTDYFQVDGITPSDLLEGARLHVQMDPTRRTSEGDVKPGRMGLEAEVTVIFNAGSDWNVSEHATIQVDLASSLTIVADNGDRLPIPDRTLTPDTAGFFTAPTVEDSTSMEFVVPDTVRSFEITFRLDAVFTAKDDGNPLDYQRSDRPENVETLTLQSVNQNP